MTRIKFDSEKAIEAAAVIARREGKRIGPMRLLKLLYIADRVAIEQRGRPIIGSRAVAMDHGPLHSDVYNMIKGDHPANPRWSRFFTRLSKRELQLDNEPDNKCLSQHDIQILNEVVDDHSDLDDWYLSKKVTHQFQEWIDNYEEGTSKPIEIEQIIDAVGRTQDKDGILQDLRDNEAFDKFFEAVT